LKNEKKVFNLPVDYEPSAVAISPDAGYIAVGGALDNKVSEEKTFFQLHYRLWLFYYNIIP